jgi:hypothetical protein
MGFLVSPSKFEEVYCIVVLSDELVLENAKETFILGVTGQLGSSAMERCGHKSIGNQARVLGSLGLL